MGKERKIISLLANYFLPLYNNIPTLILCNLLFLISSLPMVTTGASVIALSKVICGILNGRKISVWGEFWKSFRKEFPAGLLLNVTVLPVSAAASLYAAKCLQMMLLGTADLLAGCLIFTVFFLFCALCMYLFPLLAFMDARAGTVFKTAFLLCGANGFLTILGAFTTGLLLLAGLCLFPASFPIMVLIGFGLISYNACFFGWHAAMRYVFQPYYAAHTDEAQNIDIDILLPEKPDVTS
ncbi:MAG: DUF624 domain-containing protein [Candidatus Faecousia sp.]|nr:DUF624 domain-containing protein [Candidatus Faecousia sp.]